jgi:hypothetical protein
MIRLLKQALEKQGINLTKNSPSLGLTPPREVAEILLKLRPEYNGFDLIRIGEDGDGGYLIPNDLDEVKHCFSPGSDKLWKFENDLASRFKIKSYICDAGEKRPEGLSDLQDFTSAWLGPYSNGRETISLFDWVESKGLSSVEKLLQMDIEGSEFLSLLAAPQKLLQTFRIIVVEFHFLEALKNRWAFDLIYKPLFEKLFENFTVVHLHPNNCCGNFKYGLFEFPRIIEITLHRRDRSKSPVRYADIPNSLDKKNVEFLPDILIDWKRLENLRS